MSKHQVDRAGLPERDLPPELLEPPAGPQPLPPVVTAPQLLPFHELTWEDFERLCLRVARLEGDPRRARPYGVRGQAQGGIDLYSALPSARYATYQCRRYSKLSASDLGGAADDFLAGPWRRVTDRFVLCTSAPAIRTELADAVEAQRRRLAAEDPPVDFEVWDAESLSATLKNQSDIVSDFFGLAWAELFVPQSVERQPGDGPEVAEMLKELLQRPATGSQLITLDWARETLREELTALRRDRPEMFSRLTALVGSPPRPELLRAAITTPPSWLDEEGATTWELVARSAQQVGEWQAASLAWERAAEGVSPYETAGALAASAIAARVAGDAPRTSELFAAAQAAYPRHPRVVVGTLPDTARAAERLAAVAGLQSDDPQDQALILGERALGQLLTPDTAAARETLDEIERLTPGSVLARSLQVSLAVQEGRLAVMAYRALDRAALTSAARQAQELRNELGRENRWSEATRLLMLVADIQALLGERSRASAILRSAKEDEKASREQRLVLAMCAAERALDHVLARELLDDDDESPAGRRVCLEVMEELGTAEQRQEALDSLDQLVRDGGPEAAEAALVRLAATLGARPTPWSEEAAVALKQAGHERAAVQAEAFYRLRAEGFEAADQLLKPHGTATWALATRLRIALNRAAPRSAAGSSAEQVLAVGPGHSLRVEAGIGLARAGKFDRAREVLVGVARDPGAPDSARADAYEQLMHVVGDEQGDWIFADELYREWIELAPTDSRAPAWGPRVGNRLRERKARP